MRALTYTGPNELTISERCLPVPEDGEVLIKVAYAGICGTDMLAYHGGMEKRVKPPVILGHEFSGVVISTGPESEYQEGEKVTVEPLITCGKCNGCLTGEYNLCSSLNLIGIDSDGAVAGYIKVPEKNVYRLGDNISMESGAFVEPLAVCVHLIEKANVSKDQTVLIVGGGPIGLITAELAKLKGAKVIISEINSFRIDTARKLGFSVINPIEQNLMEKINNTTNGRGVNVSIEATGTNVGLVSCIEATGIKGTVILVGLPKKNADFDTYKVIAKELQLIGSRVYKREDYLQAINLIKSGSFDPTPFISRIVPLEHAIDKGFKAIDNDEDVIKILISLENEAEES